MSHDPTNTMAGGRAVRDVPAPPVRRRGRYDVARPDRLNAKLHRDARNVSPISLAQMDAPKLRLIGRYLSRNNPAVKRAFRKIVARSIGTMGIVPQFRHDGLQTAFNLWSRRAMLNGKSLRTAQTIALTDFIVEGHGFMTDGVDPAVGEFRVDGFGPSDLVPQPGKENVVGGIEFDSYRRPLNYFVRTFDPGHPHNLAGQFATVPADRVHPLYRQEEWNTLIGFSDLATGADSMYKTSDAIKAELEGLRLNAYLGMILKPDGNDVGEHDLRNALGAEIPEGATVASDDPTGGFEMQSEMAEVMTYSGDITQIDPKRPGPQFNAFVDVLFNQFAVSMGIESHSVSGDYTKANFNSLKASGNDAQITYADYQQLCVDWMFNVVARWMEWEALRGAAPLRLERMLKELDEADWLKPGRPMIDPVRETNALMMQMNAGLKTFDQACAEVGLNGRTQRKLIALQRQLDADDGVETPGIGFMDAAKTATVVEENDKANKEDEADEKDNPADDADDEEVAESA